MNCVHAIPIGKPCPLCDANMKQAQPCTPRSRPLTREQIEAWREWHKNGITLDFYAGAFDVLCDMALSAISEKTPPATVTPEQMASDRLEGAKELLKVAQLKTSDVYLQARIHNFLTGDK